MAAIFSAISFLICRYASACSCACCSALARASRALCRNSSICRNSSGVRSVALPTARTRSLMAESSEAWASAKSLACCCLATESASPASRTSAMAARSPIVQNDAGEVSATRRIIASASCSYLLAASCLRCECFSAASSMSNLRSSISWRSAFVQKVVRGIEATRADIARCSSLCLAATSFCRCLTASTASSGSRRLSSMLRNSCRVRVDKSGRVATLAAMAPCSSRTEDVKWCSSCAFLSCASARFPLNSCIRLLSSCERWLNEPVR
mmetsp:Transcript_27370/g.78874  ORF Transcript_27370/g.78874 Transcript_27370/m.78874 type:complete len:268 (-) Transcript_27370:344-1147(-)